MMPDFASKDKSCTSSSRGVPSGEGNARDNQRGQGLSQHSQLPTKVAKLLTLSADMWDVDLDRTKTNISSRSHHVRVCASMEPLARPDDEFQHRTPPPFKTMSFPTRVCHSQHGQTGVACAGNSGARQPNASITRFEADSLFHDIFLNEQPQNDMTYADKADKPSPKNGSQTAKAKACDHLQGDNQKPTMEYSQAKSAASSNEGNKNPSPQQPGGKYSQNQQLRSAHSTFGHSDIFEEDDDNVVEDDAGDDDGDDGVEIVIGPTEHAFGGHNPKAMWFAGPERNKVQVRSSTSVLFFSDIQKLTQLGGSGPPASFGSLLHLCIQDQGCRPCMFERVPGRCRKLWLCDFCHLHAGRKKRQQQHQQQRDHSGKHAEECARNAYAQLALHDGNISLPFV